MDKYYEYLYSECNCYNYDDDGEESELCLYCKREAEKAAERKAAVAAEKARLLAQPFGTEIIAIKEQLTKFESACTVAEQIEAIRSLFTVLLSYDKFLAAKPTLRNMAIKKANEFRDNSVAGPMLKELFDHFDAMIQRLPQIEGYKAE